MSTSDPVTVHRTPWQVRFIQTADDAEHIPGAFERLEAALPTLRGRKFVGAFDASAGWYRACVKSVDDPQTDEAQLPVAEIPGGSYLRIRLRNEPPALYEALPETYKRLIVHWPNQTISDRASRSTGATMRSTSCFPCTTRWPHATPPVKAVPESQSRGPTTLVTKR